MAEWESLEEVSVRGLVAASRIIADTGFWLALANRKDAPGMQRRA